MNHSFPTRRHSFAAVLGITDGILTALTLASARIIQANSHHSFPLSLAVRVATASALAGGVVFFTAELAQRNFELVHAERELNLAARGYLATTRLGHFVLVESLGAATVVTASTFLGAFLPLLLGATFREFPWTPIGFAIALLGILGALIGRVTYRSKFRWATALMGTGGALTFLGVWLHIV
jgi:VIT1/CCC1 family predicted Fe2+/Mn2+ transporter